MPQRSRRDFMSRKNYRKKNPINPENHIARKGFVVLLFARPDFYIQSAAHNMRRFLNIRMKLHDANM